MIQLKLRATFMLIALATLSTVAKAQIPEGYYSSLTGKKGAALKQAIYELIKDADVYSYGSGSGSTWYGFYTTDRMDNNQVVDRYSDDVRYFTSQGSVISGMNIEHSFPKSWWGGNKNQAYQDLYNLMPSESKINSSKSNYPMGVVTKTTTDNGCTKVGDGDQGKLWEPADKWKGDFARGYMYMATTYQNLSWSGSSALEILDQGAYPTLKEWAYKLYIKWAKVDIVDAMEVKRNNAVSKIQGNRNPYIDFPNLMDYVWGDSVDYAFDPATSLKSSDYVNGDVQPGDEENTIYTALFTSSNGDCTIENANGTTQEVWIRDVKYGWKGTGYINSNRNAVQSTLLTPEMDLTGYDEATLTFNHAVNYCESPSSVLAVKVICDGTETTLNGITWPTGNSWTFNDSGNISLNDFIGKKIKIAFYYTSTTTEASTWEIKSIAVQGKKHTTNISGVVTEGYNKPDFTKPYEVYSIDGRKVNPDSQHGITIIRQGGKSWKVIR